jgi:hypothetical protein
VSVSFCTSSAYCLGTYRILLETGLLIPSRNLTTIPSYFRMPTIWEWVHSNDHKRVVGTNPTGELITSGLPVVEAQSREAAANRLRSRPLLRVRDYKSMWMWVRLYTALRRNLYFAIADEAKKTGASICWACASFRCSG